MKKIINLFLFTIIMLSFSCQKQETIAYYTGATASVLIGTSNTGSTSISLKATDSTLTALTLNWTNPNYTYNYGISSVDVSYLIEIDTLGSNFTNPNRAQIGITKDLGSVMTEGFLNNQLSNVMGLATSVTHNIQIRVTATIKTTGTNTNPVVSNVISFTATPYAPPPVMQPPASHVLYIVGDATPGGWPPLSNNQSIEQFTTVSATDYVITIPLNGDGTFKFVEVVGQWAQQWGVQNTQTSGDPTTFSAKLFFNGNNCKAPLASGTYKIEVNFQTGVYTAVKQ